MARELVDIPIGTSQVRLKVDENLVKRCIEILAARRHDVATVASQSMMSAEDREYSGIAVLRVPSKPTYASVLAVVQTVGGQNRTREAGRQVVVHRDWADSKLPESGRSELAATS
jgi:hypothetical protein